MEDETHGDFAEGQEKDKEHDEHHEGSFAEGQSEEHGHAEEGRHGDFAEGQEKDPDKTHHEGAFDEGQGEGARPRRVAARRRRRCDTRDHDAVRAAGLTRRTRPDRGRRWHRRRARPRPGPPRRARHARRTRRVHVRDDGTSPRPAAQRRAVRRERPRVGGGMHRGEPDPPCDRTRFVRGERRAVRGDRRRGHGVPAGLPRGVRGVGHPGGAAHATAGPSPGTDAEPAAEGRGACARRNDGRDADAPAVLRDGEAERRVAAEPRRGDGVADPRRRRERRRRARPCHRAATPRSTRTSP